MHDAVPSHGGERLQCDPDSVVAEKRRQMAWLGPVDPGERIDRRETQCRVGRVVQRHEPRTGLPEIHTCGEFGGPTLSP